MLSLALAIRRRSSDTFRATHVRGRRDRWLPLTVLCLSMLVMAAQAASGLVPHRAVRDFALARKHDPRDPVHPVHKTAVPLPAESVERVGRFLDELASTMPTIVRNGLVGERQFADTGLRPFRRFANASWTYDYMKRQTIPVDPTRSLARLDSLQRVWAATDPVVRAYWLIPNGVYDENGVRIVAAFLTEVLQNGTLLEPASRLAEALLRVDAVAAGREADATIASLPDSIADIRPTLRGHVSAIAHLGGAQLVAMIELARGDTAAAMEGLRRPMRENDDLGLRAAYTLDQLATARHDTAARAEALGMLVTKLGGMPQDKITTHTQFVALYPVWHRKDPRLQADPEQYLDSLFQDLFDHDIPVTRSSATATHRMAVLEYRTGLGCGSCWGHDRVAAALLQRYPADALAILAYEYGCPPLSNEIDAPQERIERWYPHAGLLLATNISHVVQFSTLPDSDWAPRDRAFPLRMADPWINGLPPIDPEGSFLARKYKQYVARIDSVLAQPPEATLALNVMRHGDMVHVELSVDSVRASHRHIAARITLIQDTVRVKGATNRRLQYAVVRGAAQSPGLPIGIPLEGAIGGHQTAQYRFDLAAIAEQYKSQRTPAATLRKLYPVDSVYKRELEQKERAWNAWVTALPDPDDSRIDRNRLQVVAFVQDLDSGEILQAVRLPLNATTAPMATAAVHQSGSTGQGGE